MESLTNFITERMIRNIERQEFDFIMILGRFGWGKSCLLMRLLYRMYDSWRETFTHLCCMTEELMSLLDYAKMRSSERPFRFKAIGWDDIGVMFHRKRNYSPGEYALFGDLTGIRPYVANLIGTAAHIEEVPGPLVPKVTMRIICDRPFHAQVFEDVWEIHYKSPDKSYYHPEKLGTIKWAPLPPGIFDKYNEWRNNMMLRQSVRRQMFTLSSFNISQTVARMDPELVADFVTLYNIANNGNTNKVELAKLWAKARSYQHTRTSALHRLNEILAKLGVLGLASYQPYVGLHITELGKAVYERVSQGAIQPV